MQKLAANWPPAFFTRILFSIAERRWDSPPCNGKGMDYLLSK
jgi:hypothetical protein